MDTNQSQRFKVSKLVSEVLWTTFQKYLIACNLSTISSEKSWTPGRFWSKYQDLDAHLDFMRGLKERFPDKVKVERHIWKCSKHELHDWLAVTEE